MAYAPTATANTVAVLLSAEEAEDMTKHRVKSRYPRLRTPEQHQLREVLTRQGKDASPDLPGF